MQPDCRTESFFFLSGSSDGHPGGPAPRRVPLFARLFLPAGKPAAVVQIAHGMRESTDYYEEFCRFLTRRGVAVAIHDARGHGRTAGPAGSNAFRHNAGRLPEPCMEQMAGDLIVFRQMLRKKFPGQPVFLLGHSMGSVLARLATAQERAARECAAAENTAGPAVRKSAAACSISRDCAKASDTAQTRASDDRAAERAPQDGWDGLLLSGTAGPWPEERFSRLLTAARAEEARRGELAPAVETPALLFAHFNDRFQPAVTGSEYMSRDAEMVRRALRSPDTAVKYSCGFYVSFLLALQKAGSPENIGRIPKRLPILLFSGDEDPLGDNGAGVRALAALFRAAGIRDVTCRLYPGGRHEMLRETNRREVFADVLGWLLRRLPRENELFAAADGKIPPTRV